jgi:hypothetical protein
MPGLSDAMALKTIVYHFLREGKELGSLAVFRSKPKTDKILHQTSA